MNFFKQLFKTTIHNINTLYEKMRSKSVDMFSYAGKDNHIKQYVHCYHKSKTSLIIIDLQKYVLLQDAIDYAFIELKKNMDKFDFNIFNIIVKFRFIDDLNINYNQSLTYKELFIKQQLDSLNQILIKDINELLTQYKSSRLVRLELRIDFFLK